MSEKIVELNNKTYKLKVYLKFQQIYFELDGTDKKYSNSLGLNDLRNSDRYFREIGNVNDALEDINYLLDNEELSISEEKDSAFLKIIRRRATIEFKLIEQRDYENQNIYDSLSNKMKEIINANELILGIDLGTTYSCASVMLDDKIIVIENSLGKRTTPSYVLFLKKNNNNINNDNNQKIYVCLGELAKLQPSYQKNIIYNSKRLIGKNWNDPEIQSIRKNLTFQIEEDNVFDLLKIRVAQKDYYPDEISAMILKKIVNDSEYYLSNLLGKDIKIRNSVITSPAYFNQKQRKAILNAANIINLNVKRIINEPTSASLAYLYNNLNNVQRNIIVIDFGGGTFDITYLYLKQGENNSYCDIKCTGGDPNFGGEDFDNIIMSKCIQSITNNHNNNNYNLDKKLPQNIRLKRACENAKINLSTKNETRIFLEEYLPAVNIDLTLTKAEFEELCSGLFIKFQSIIEQFLNENNVDKTTINEVIPIGGSTLIPKIKNILQSLFVHSTINTTLDPKEVVSIGAAIQGGIFSKIDSLKNYNLLDITNYSVGVELVRERMSKIIKKYTPIPIELKNSYVNAYDYQTEIPIKVYEGESEDVKNNIYLGEFLIANLPRKKAGKIHIEVKFDIDQNSILNAKAFEEENRNNFSKEKFNLEKNNEIEVENPKGLMKIIDTLREKENSLEYVDIKLYIETIKNSIIVAEREINKLKENEEQNRELIKEKNKFILEKFGSMINVQLEKSNEEYEKNINLSYIKLYFNKITNYFKNYVDDSFKQKIFENNIEKIIMEIQFDEPKIIFEILEDFSDDNFFLKKCIVFLIQNLYGKFTEKIQNIEFQQIDNDELEKFKKEVENIESLFKKLKKLKIKEYESNPIPTDIKYIPDYLKSYRLKIEIIKFIRIYSVINMNKRTKEELKSLVIEYKKCLDTDANLLRNLNQLLNETYLRDNNRIDLILFDPKNYFNLFYPIFSEYPPLEQEYDIQSEFKYKSRRIDFWNDALIRYQKSIDKINDENLKSVYNKIIIAINKVRNNPNIIM